MNTYQAYTDYFTDIAAKLCLLGREPGRTNLFFVSSPEEADVLLGAIRNDCTWPCLLVEYFDEPKLDASGEFTEVQGGFVVLAQADKRQKGVDDSRAAIYERAKPAADAIAAKMLHDADEGQLLVGNERVYLPAAFEGNWAGPLHNNLYGWRYTFTWRIGGGLCYDAELWS